MTDSTSTENKARSYWFVVASFGGTEDQTERFLREGIWESDDEDKYGELVNSIKTGDRIAIKATYTRKHNLPFDNRGHHVSVMAIKAIGIVIENLGDGRTLKVDWQRADPPREWYFFTNRYTIWRVVPGNWASNALIEFTFQNKPQDIDRFRNDPFWRERYGDISENKYRFPWTKMYETIADRLLQFKKDRSILIVAIHQIASRVDGLSHLQDQYSDGTSGPLRDICPFTTFGIFNRGLSDKNRKIILKELASFLNVDEPIPEAFDGIPILNNMSSWFFGYEKERNPDTIDKLWNVFEQAIRLADTDDPDAQSAFVQAFDRALEIKGVGWNLTTGLYWIRPWFFSTLDRNSRQYITKKLGIKIEGSGPGKRCTGTEYLKLKETLEARFHEENYSVHSFPELSLEAWYYKPIKTESPPQEPTDTEVTASTMVPYTIEDILGDGCFLERVDLENLLERLRTKKNLILQGPPGTGKTWLSKRLAYALIGQKDESKVRVVQFHPNLSYEDFVRGWRPSGDGKLSLVDGPFMELVNVAKEKPSDRFVMVIEEINRGNPAQIFGEMLTLLEADKRTPNAALELCYQREENENVFIPNNLYVIGTMNIADRSLALVDFALRRRFAFVTLEPTFGDRWLEWVHKNFQIPMDFLKEIKYRINKLNEIISTDPHLGPQFKVGHSFITPPRGIRIIDHLQWFRQVVDTEIRPLLEEYWFDALDKAADEAKKLIEDL